MEHLFVGHITIISDIYPFNKGKYLIYEFQDNIRYRGEM